MIVLSIVFILIHISFNNGQEVYITAPRLVSQNGNLKIYPGYNRNISLEVFGDDSWINIGKHNLLLVLQDAINATQTVKRISSSLSLSQTSSGTLPRRQLYGPRGILRRLNDLEAGTGNSTSGAYPVGRRQFQLLKTRVNNLRRRVNTLEQRLNNLRNIDECSSTPCQNGGTCIETIKGYKCLCPANWEGPVCATDVNECSHFAGTDLGCQNGATCLNTPGSYECRCMNGWFGLHCTKRSGDCSSATNEEICGHGICVPQNNALGYKCICDQGWTTKENAATCTQDVNECQGNHYPCSVIPMVPCINMPGTFLCGSCPAGYTGNGYYCTDINECLTNNGGCSTNPNVECINTVGSRMCGDCPPGYQGNGVFCTFVGICHVNNGGCHTFADCFSNPMIGPTYVQCHCRAGYTGSGYGPMGCVPSTVSGVPTLPPNAIPEAHCVPNPCVHGTCQMTPAGRKCVCDVRYTGTLCDQPRDPCVPQPCLNGGTCVGDKATMGYRCECTTQYTGHNCDTRTSTCGGVRDMSEGRIVYPDSNSTTYNHNSRCAWVIVTQQNKVLNVTFTRFNLEISSDCLYDWLQIHDGHNSASHYIGRFCGNTLPMGGNIISTRNVLYLWFRSDHTVSKNGFELSWTSIDPICGEEINATSHGIIKSPGSPGKYPNNRDCMWIINAPLDKRIQLHFYTMQIESSTDCDHDYLIIYDGPTVDGKELAKYCGSIHPTPLLIASPSALVYFHSDAYTNDYGFQISYAVVDGEPGCGVTYTQDGGEIVPPKLKGHYVNHITCEYKIILTPDTAIKLTFLEFSLEYSSSCQFDNVAVYDGDTREAPLLGKYCGTNIPPVLLSSSNKVLIVFESDETYTAEGFRIVYEKLCHTNFEAPSGIIKSPGYPKTYPDQIFCTYLINVPPGNAIVLNFIDFDIEERYLTHSNCNYDYLKIYDSDVALNTTVIGQYCGNNESRPPEIVSSHNSLFMEFTSDSSIAGSGFKINYTTVAVECGAILKEMSGTIEYPDSSKGVKYDNFKSCKWVLSAPSGYIIELIKHTFDLEQTNECTADFVEVSSNDTVTGVGEVLGRFCGTEFPAVITSNTNMMTIRFESDVNQVANGFSFHYLFSDVRKVCGGTFLSASGVIASPGWPNNYPDKKDCYWVIRAPEGQQIALNVSTFELESHSMCGTDYLEIRNGGFESSPLIGKYCGVNIPLTIPSLTNSLFLHFHSDYSKKYGGFYITWDSTSRGCGGILTSSHGSITSPNFPNKYGHNAECFWRITTNAGSQIHLTFVTLDLENVSLCVFDYVEIYEDGGTKLGRYCSLDSAHSPIISKSNNVYVRFQTDGFTAGLGFMLNYNTICNRNLTDMSGVIESPNYPDKYPDQIECLWVIRAPKGNKINITFSHFDLESMAQTPDSSTVHFDYVELKDGSEFNNTKTYSGHKLPPLYQSNDNTVFVKFHTDYFHRYTGFRLEWVVDGCGGYLRHPTDTFTSPGYPSLYPRDTECQWIIEVDPDKSIELKINDLDTELYVDCKMDALSIYNGPSDQFPNLLTVCGRHDANYSVITSTGNYLFVKFYSDYSISSRGFKATYKSVDSKCGGKFQSFGGVITSPDYPKNYDNDLECFYYLEVPDYHTMSLQFTDFDLNDMTADCNDYVKVYDGDSITSPLLTKYCGSRPTGLITSTTNKLTLEFKTDSHMVAKGFSANYTMLCGVKIVTSTEGVISRTNSFSKEEDNCTWNIISEKLDAKVSLTFTFLELENSMNCTESYVEVFGGSSLSSPSLGKYCGSKSPSMIVSRGNALTVHLITKSVSSFSFHYSVLNNACGGNFKSESGEFTSPMYPDSYASNIGCVWILNVSPGISISLSFSEFSLQSSENCEQDFVEVRKENGAGELIGVYCGNELPPTISSFKNLWVKFSSDAEDVDKGFIAHYAYNKMNEIVDVESGYLTSPLYPHYYKREGLYEWRIMVQPGGYIVISIQDIYIPIFGSSCISVLEVYDGYSEEAPILGSFCGVETPSPISTTANVAFIRLAMIREEDSGYMLKLHWNSMALSEEDTRTNKNCGNTSYVYLEGGKYVLTSPGYPGGYNDSLHCEWIFETNPLQHLVVRFPDVSLEDTMECHSDKIILYSGDKGMDNWKMVGSPICQANASQMENIRVNNLLKIVFESDISVNKSGFIAMIFSDCGNTVTQSSGIINPNIGNLFRFQKDCEWDITVRNGRTVKVEFLNLNISNSDNTCKVYLMIRDGGTIHSPLLGKGKFCDSSIPTTPLITSSNRLHVTYHIPTAVSLLMLRNTNNNSFKLRFSEVTLPCGDRITLTDDYNSTEISSPNYPEIPNPHSECSWIFVGQAVHRLSITFIDRFDLTTSNNCDEEYVEVRDGGTENSPLLGRFCSKPSKSVKSTNNMLYLKYFTDIPVPKNGFKAKVSIDICGGTLYGGRGKIISPTTLSLAFAKTDVVCDWNIIGPYTHTIYMNIIILRTMSNDCSQRSLQIFDNSAFPNATMTPLTEKLCTEQTITVNSPTNEALVRFSISKAVILEGIMQFIINFNTSSETCGGDYNQPSGVIEMPKNQAIYARRSCEWTLTVPEGRRIKLQFIVNETNIQPTKYPNYWFGVFNGHSTNLLLTYFVRSVNSSRIVESSSNKMLIMFLGRSKTIPALNCKLVYTSDEPSVCDGQFAYGEGIILPPTASFPKVYCEYPYKTVAEYFNGTLQIEHNDPDTKICEDSMFNFIVYVSVPGIGKLANLCPRKVVLSPYVKTVIHVQRASVVYTGYVVHYKVNHCGGVINDIGDGNDLFILPSNHTGPLNCVWVINTPSAQILEVKVNKLVFSSGGCEKEHLYVRIGSTPSSFISTDLCHHKETLTYHQNHIWIEYLSDTNTTNTILNISLSLHSKDSTKWWACGGELNWPITKTFTSPNFPRQYPENKECEWILNGDIGYRVALTFENRFHLQSSPNCTKDYIEVSDFKFKTWTVIGRYCGRTLPPVINSTAERLKLLFHSDESLNADGFQARWSLFCGGELEVTSEPQRLRSPGQFVYGKNLNCKYLLTHPESEGHINLKFEYFELEGDVQDVCKFDNLTIQSMYNTYEAEETFCGKKSPGYKRLLGPVKIHFMTDKWVQRRGFSIIYSMDSCGGNINKSGEVISSISSNENKYFRSMNCEWRITAPIGQAVVLRFRSFILEYSLKCGFDYLEIFEALNKTEDTKPLARLCGNLTLSLPTFKSKGNEMLVVFTTDYSNEFDGFTADVIFTYDESHGCGGTVNLTSSLTPFHIFSDKKVYEPYLDCHWTFKAPVDTYIKIKFTEFNVSKCFNSSTTGNCDCDYLEVRDGLSTHSQLIGRYCGDELPENLTSSNNYLWIRFVSDGTVQSSGVQIYASVESSICGKSYRNVTSEVQILDTPGLSSGALPKNIKCDWYINADADNIHLNFAEFDVGVKPLFGNHCSTEYVELIYENKLLDEDAHIIAKPHGAYGLNNDQFYMTATNPPKKLCGLMNDFEDYVMYSNLRIKLITSNFDQRHKGFRLQYSEIGCSRNFTKTYGRILSKKSQPEYDRCKVTITAPASHTVSLYIMSYYANTQNCEEGYLEILDGTKKDSPSLRKYCQDIGFTALFSTGNTMTINFVTNQLRFYTYMFSFLTTDKGRGCGGTIPDRYGKIFSPLYPEKYVGDSVCEWIINSPDPTITLFFDVYDFGFTKNCESNYVELFDVNGMSLVKYCTKEFPAPFRILSSYVKIVYNTNSNNYGTGWVMNFANVFYIYDCNYQMWKWGKRESPECDCGAQFQTIQHLVEECPDGRYERATGWTSMNQPQRRCSGFLNENQEFDME